MTQFGNVQPAGFPGLPEDWISDWETFPSADQSIQIFEAVLHAREWKNPRALLIVHGLGEHGGRYMHAPHYLRGVVDAVYCVDQRGHGRSEGLRGHCDQFSQFTDDLAMVILRTADALKKRFGEKAELHVLGHSFGGLVTLRTLFLNPGLPVASATVSSPLLGIAVKVPAIKRLAGRAIAEIWGTLQMSNEIDTSKLSHDPAVAVAYERDRLVHDKVTPKLYVEMTAAMQDTLSRDSGLNYPLQMLVSADDHVVDAELAQKFFRGLKIRDKQLKVYPGFFHEPFSEVEKQKAFEDVAKWVTSHSKV